MYVLVLKSLVLFVVVVCFFRIPWFQYPIIYDIRAKPRKISSLTGSKGTYYAINVIYEFNSDKAMQSSDHPITKT